ncbi:hypothetical protein HDC92_000603 [Pedobacter sp. AK017]|uniref:hypothetical protein n=1 Tax=Pedobacter sp. AK017 TaxID=2723073 RepID=UPI001621E9FC|nr:hypothetical protein [Pedobacter sp. AK017]MBB5436939.1 hypothetical protein [Pedobacter sp. AK017]
MLEKTNVAIGSKHNEKKKSKPRRKNDELLKGAFEDNFPDFLRFVFPDADDVIDFQKGIEFMDKELCAIIPDRERKRDKRVADLLAKIYLKDGKEKWVLLNVEIEGGNDPDFAYRLYQYNYRIRDRYKVSVAAIAVFTGDQRQARPAEYKDQLLGTKLSFKYLTYHVFDHSQAILLEKQNPFALITLACQNALLEGKIPDEELGINRLAIARKLLSYNYNHDRIISFLVFLKNFIFIDDKEINSKFDQQIIDLTGGAINMGIIETIKMQERREGKIDGAKEKSHEVVKNLILELGLSDDQAAKIAAVSVSYVKQVRKELTAQK